MKFKILFGMLLALVVAAYTSHPSYAGVAGDVACWGGTPASATNEICIKSVGSIVPGTTNVASLGTSALRFKDLFLQGDANVAGTMTQTGVLTLSAQLVPLQRTVTQINTLVPTVVGAVVICTNCTIPYSLCTATGTLAAQWARAGSATVGCGTGN